MVRYVKCSLYMFPSTDHILNLHAWITLTMLHGYEHVLCYVCFDALNAMTSRIKTNLLFDVVDGIAPTVKL